MPKVTMMSRAQVKDNWRASDLDLRCIAESDFELLDHHGLDVPVVENIDAEILKAIERGGKLEMGDWHDWDGCEYVAGSTSEERLRQAVCGTTHCRAGWAIHLAGEAGFKLEMALDPETAGSLIYFASTGSVPDFFCVDDLAMEDIKRCAGVEP